MNPNWKGKKVGYGALHTWIKKRLVKPKICQLCRKNAPYDLANKNNKYKRKVSDWLWLCRKCHMQIDGRIEKLKKEANKYRRRYTIPNDKKKECIKCGRKLKRKRFNKKNRIECFGNYNKRKFCDNICCNQYYGERRKNKKLKS